MQCALRHTFHLNAKVQSAESGKGVKDIAVGREYRDAHFHGFLSMR